MATDNPLIEDDNAGLLLQAFVTFDDVTGEITDLKWSNLGTVDATLLIRVEGRPTVTTTCRSGRTNVKVNLVGAPIFYPDGVNVEMRGY